MYRDFTIKVYEQLLTALSNQGYTFQSYSDYVSNPGNKVILLRHDVDDRNKYSLRFARLQYEKQIVGTYYFRMVPKSFNKDLIREIASIGHEIGYHYEDMDFAKGNEDKAYDLAKKHLVQLREVADVKTICMHGSPRSPYDNREVWKKYDYRELGIIAEPYFDIDFNDVFYVTDTGRMWDGHKASIRDKVPVDQKKKWPVYHSTFDIIEAVNYGEFPDRVMMNFHPQRWTDNPFLWTKELASQKMKNVVKRGFLKIRS